MKRHAIVILAGFALLTVLTGCAESNSSETEGEAIEAEASDLKYELQWIEPPSEDDFMAGLEQREPELMMEFSQDELIELARTGCELADGYVLGDDPSPVDELSRTMIDQGHEAGISEGIASDIRDAADGSICDLELVEVN